MIHIHEIPDCPKCGTELTMLNQGHDHTDASPWGTWFTAWYLCIGCKWESEKAKADTRYEAKKKLMDMYGEKAYSRKEEKHAEQI